MDAYLCKLAEQEDKEDGQKIVSAGATPALSSEGVVRMRGVTEELLVENVHEVSISDEDTGTPIIQCHIEVGDPRMGFRLLPHPIFLKLGQSLVVDLHLSKEYPGTIVFSVKRRKEN